MTEKVIYFIVGSVPTAAEQLAINELNAIAIPIYEIVIRNSEKNTLYGIDLEESDLVAGTVPSAYSGVANFGVVNALKPKLFKVFPAVVSVAVSATFQVYSISVTGTNVANIIFADVTSGLGVVYVSSDPSKATVASTGIVTGIAEGTSTITATYTYATGLTVISTCDVTVTA